MQKDWCLDWMQVLQQMKRRSRHHTLAYLVKKPWFLADFFSLHAVIVSSGESIRSFFLEWTDSITRVFHQDGDRFRPAVNLHSATSPCCSCVLTQSEIRAAAMELKVTGLAGDVICVVNISDLERVSDLKEPEVRSASCQRGTSWAQFSSPTLKTAGEVDDLLTSIDILNHFHTFFQMILNIFTCLLTFSHVFSMCLTLELR